MKVRELLQTEIWSKETSRKVLAKVRKVLLRISIVVGILVVVLGIVLAVEMSWLTAGERKVATAALAETDAMQNLVQASGSDFEARDQHAKEMVAAADRASLTLRDKSVAFDLSYYLSETEMARRDIEMRVLMQQKKIHRSDEWLKLDRNSDALNLQIRSEFRSAVLKWLR
jgi:hypothetical protein